MTFKIQVKSNNICGLTSGKIVIDGNILCSKIYKENYIIGKKLLQWINTKEFLSFG